MQPHKNNFAWMSISILLAGSLTFTTLALAKPGRRSPSDPQADDTGKNLPTAHKDSNRADQQSHAASDVELAKKIRQSIMQDKSLSTYGHNVKVITNGGIVHLKGPVRSPEEKDSIGTKAAAIAGAENVKNDLTLQAGRK